MGDSIFPQGAFVLRNRETPHVTRMQSSQHDVLIGREARESNRPLSNDICRSIGLARQASSLMVRPFFLILSWNARILNPERTSSYHRNAQ